MALQHFYSRVPAKISMFNRTDSFDTFACSAELEREYIEKELAAVCDNKPTPQEAASLRLKALQNCYVQFVDREGRLVQSCATYLPKDYTGERTTYLVHNLVFDPQETHDVLCNPQYNALNAQMFCSDLDKFDITNPAARPMREYPALAWAPQEAEDTSWVLHQFDNSTLKRFIYAMLNCVCGKYKSVFFVLSDQDPSLLGLRFINTMLQIMPYHLRQDLSFASRVSEYNRFANIKLKCVPAGQNSAPIAKGVTFDFLTKNVVGVKDEDVTANGQVVEFFFSLLANDALRREFLLACNHAVSTVPSMGAQTMKALSDLVFLFRASSGMYDEKAILPNDDKVEEFFAIYDKARPALSDEYRITASKCLQRYPQNHTPIPKAVFAKLSKIYPTEIVGTKHVIMTVVLDLIHTDIMRDKLFGFVRNNYEGEDDETKARINEDLCRVFYGGFLQPQILTFLDAHFAAEPVATQDMVVEKVLLAIRTKQVQAQILQFLRAHYNELSAAAKDNLYTAILENLPDGDELALQLTVFVNEHIMQEDEALRASFVARLCKEIETEQRRKEHPMLAMLPRTEGFVGQAILGKLMREWPNRKIFGEYVGLLTSGTMAERIARIIAMWQVAPDIDEPLAEMLLRAIAEAQAANPTRTEVFALLSLETELCEALGALGTVAKGFCERYLDEVLRPAVGNGLWDVFRRTTMPNAVETLVQYVELHPAAQSAKFHVLQVYLAVKKAMLEGDVVACVTQIEAFPRDRSLHQNVAAYLTQDVLHAPKIGVTVCFAQAMAAYLKTGGLHLRDIYERRQEPFEVPVAEAFADEKVAKKKGKKNNEDADRWDRQCAALQEVLAVGNDVVGYAQTPEMRAVALDESAEYAEIVGMFVGGWDKKGVKQVHTSVDKLRPKNAEFAEHIRKLCAQIRPVKKGLFGK